jgi:exodeoxyribonuclease VII small subunit
MAKKNEGYEELLKKLDDIVVKMEAGDMPLEESLNSYEEGIKLVNRLYKELTEAEGKVNLLNQDQLVDFEDK